MDEKKKNILVYIGLVVLIVVIGVCCFVLGLNMHNTPDENGVVSTKKTTFTKEEIKDYIETFTKNFDLSKEFDNISEISDYDKLTFAFRVYKNRVFGTKSSSEYTIPVSEVQKIVNEYFGIKNFNYALSGNETFIKLNDEKTSYVVRNSILFYINSSENLVTTVLDVLDDGKIVKIKLSGSVVAGEYNILLNENKNITAFKKIQNNKYEKINYEIVTINHKYFNDYKLKVNGKMLDDFSLIDEKGSNAGIVQLDDILVITICSSGCAFIIVDKDGNIIKSHIDYDNKGYKLNLKGSYYNYHRVDGNDIIIGTTDMWYGTSFWDLCRNYKQHVAENKPVNFEEKITYLGNGKFSDPVLLKTESAETEKSRVFPDLDCSKYE